MSRDAQEESFRPATLDGLLSIGSIKILFVLEECGKIISIWQTPEKTLYLRQPWQFSPMISLALIAVNVLLYLIVF